MSLRIDLKPREKIFINGAVISNGESRSSFDILNDAAILREKDILTEATADTPCKRVYLLVQLMYMDPPSRANYEKAYGELRHEILTAAPSTLGLFGQIDDAIGNGRYYPALKVARTLIAYEQELVNHVK